MKACRKLLLLPVAFLLFVTNLYAQVNSSQRFSLDEDWLFHLGDLPFPAIKGHGASYMAAKAGVARGAAAVDFDDSEWRKLNVPHDWAMEHNVNPNENVAQGYRTRGYGWYRRKFHLDTADRGKNLELQFDGIATHATIWVNGQIMHRSWSAYNSFYIDISAIAKYGEEVNTIAIRVDAEAMEGWWYEGAGIYRHTWLVKRNPVHIITDGVWANPVAGSNGNWNIPAEITITNTGHKTAQPRLVVSLYNKLNQLVTTAEAATVITPLERKAVQLQLPVQNPELWNLDAPVLYKVVTEIINGTEKEQVTTTCGFRTIRFDADSGFYLNNKRIKIKGVCNHIDHAGVGTAVPDALWEFRLNRIKEMGANAYRCSHNAPSAKLLDLCDSLGILVMDENRNFNAAPEYIAQLQWLIRRDRNHPSVILWSVFNEEPIQGTETGYEMVRRMAKEVKKLDTTRPVTAAMNGGFFGDINVSQAVDVVGFNYEIKQYDKFHRENPQVPATSSEDASAVMIRGVYHTDTAKHTLDSYDTQAPSWGASHRKSWKEINERPWLAGAFVWTGFDYHGEPTPYTWPTANSSFGIVDICGFPKTAFFLRQALWINDKPVLHIAPHWNWPNDSIGKPIKVMVMTNAQSVQLFLNGKKIGEKLNDPYEMLSWQVPYQPGKLEAVSYTNGKEMARFAVETTGAPVRLQLTPYRKSLANNGIDATPITVEALDAQGKHVPTANLPVVFTTNDNGAIIGLGNGNPNSHEPEKGDKQSLFNGLAQVIIQSNAGSSGTITLEAKANGLQSAKLSIPLIRVPVAPAIPAVASALILDKWRLSPVFTTRPDPNQQLSDNDMNSWAAVQPGKLPAVTADGYVIYRATFKPYAAQQKKGGTILLSHASGITEVWVDGKNAPLASIRKRPDGWQLPFPAGESHIINILVKQEKGTATGLNGLVKVSE